MKMHQLVVGMLETNSFVLENGKIAVIIDPGEESSRFIDLLTELKLELKAILLTHGHADHIGAVGVLRNRYPETEVISHKEDMDSLVDPTKNLAALMGIPLNVGAVDRTVEDGDILRFEDIELEVRHVPGHTPGHVVFIHQGQDAFVGDTLFSEGIGRWDFPTGNGELLIRSIKEKLLTLDDSCRVYPGHGPNTTIGQERG
jgi:hydroxyacylglutathione hydrolase